MKNFSILSFLLFTACNSAQIPVGFLYDIDTKNEICGKWEIVDKATMRLELKERLDLKECNGFMAIDYNDYLAFKRWAIEKQKQSKN